MVQSIASSLKLTLNENCQTLFDYLQELAVVVEINEIPDECVLIKNDQIIVFIKPSTGEDAILQLIARIRLKHVKYYDTYPESLKAILDDEVALFMQSFEQELACLV
ncbi:hypothetical protein [Syntrophomonas palmitatica]|uniref:hypothetical protein n=1 Tax=Syntrophomonas palmitatica TaxID=402877 RepID=UPI0006D0A2F3|nr:hypothetical protein [Syntrophomonas palmitatica]